MPLTRYTPQHYIMMEAGDGEYVKIDDVIRIILKLDVIYNSLTIRTFSRELRKEIKGHG